MMRLHSSAAMALVLLAGPFDSDASAQQAVPRDSTRIERLRVYLSCSQPAVAVLRQGKRPLVFVDGVRTAPLKPATSCAPAPEAPSNVRVAYIRPHVATDLFGSDGKDGAILVTTDARLRRPRRL